MSNDCYIKRASEQGLTTSSKKVPEEWYFSTVTWNRYTPALFWIACFRSSDLIKGRYWAEVGSVYEKFDGEIESKDYRTFRDSYLCCHVEQAKKNFEEGLLILQKYFPHTDFTWSDSPEGKSPVDQFREIFEGARFPWMILDLQDMLHDWNHFLTRCCLLGFEDPNRIFVSDFPDGIMYDGSVYPQNGKISWMGAIKRLCFDNWTGPEWYDDDLIPFYEDIEESISGLKGWPYSNPNLARSEHTYFGGISDPDSTIWKIEGNTFNGPALFWLACFRPSDLMNSAVGGDCDEAPQESLNEMSGRYQMYCDRKKAIDQFEDGLQKLVRQFPDVDFFYVGHGRQESLVDQFRRKLKDGHPWVAADLREVRFMFKHFDLLVLDCLRGFENPDLIFRYDPATFQEFPSLALRESGEMKWDGIIKRLFFAGAMPNAWYDDPKAPLCENIYHISRGVMGEYFS